jgi:pimeloyl-ACP methyl ester carboxylesterase
MPFFECAPGVQMHYVVDDYTDPWTKPETVLMLHGNCESGQAWYGWVPHLARRYRVVRPDMRGFGQSTPMPADFDWPMDTVIADFVRLMDHLQVDRFHVVAAKIGGVISRSFAARQASRVQTLTVVGSPPPVRGDRHTAPDRVREVREEGIERWARRSMGQFLRESRGSPAHRVPDARHRDQGQQPRLGRRDRVMGEDDTKRDVEGDGRGFVSLGGDGPGRVRAGDARFHQAPPGAVTSLPPLRLW